MHSGPESSVHRRYTALYVSFVFLEEKLGASRSCNLPAKAFDAPGRLRQGGRKDEGEGSEYESVQEGPRE